MGTTIRTHISTSNQYYISKHEYLMTKHFAMQYPDWKKAKQEIESRIAYGYRIGGVQNNEISKPTEAIVEATEGYSVRMNLVEQVAKIAGEDIWEFVLLGVTTECNYDYLHLVKGMPCCKDVYYKMYRKFFWILNRELYNLFNGKSIFKEE